MADEWVGLAGVLLGGVLTTAGAMTTDYLKLRREQRNLAVAVAGEVAAVSQLIRARKWLDETIKYHQWADDGQVVQLEIHLPAQTLTVCREAMRQSGKLGGILPDRLPRLVMVADGIISDLTRLAAFPPGVEGSLLESEYPEGAALVYRELADMLEAALAYCDEIVGEVAKQYPDVRIVMPRPSAVSG